MKTIVGVLFGCPSVEHEVGIISAIQAMDALNKDKYDVVPIYIDKKGTWYVGEGLTNVDKFKDMPKLLNSCVKVIVSPNASDGSVFLYPEGLFNKKPIAKIDVFLPVSHGAYAEDGSLQGFLEMTHIPYCGPNVLSAAVGMDKIAQKAVCKMGGIPVLDCFWFYSDEWAARETELVDFIENKFSYPVITKPATLGSSIGIKIANDKKELIESIDTATRYCRKVLVEPAIRELREINVAVLGDGNEAIASVLEEPLGSDAILSFADKYLADDSSKSSGMASLKRRIPAEVSPETERKIKDIALDAFYCLNGRGVCRMDFMIDTLTDEIYLNEVNTIPGSLSFYLWEPTGMKYSELLDKLIEIALKARRKKDATISVYESNILSQGGFKGKK